MKLERFNDKGNMPVKRITQDEERFIEHLRSFQDNWDGEDATSPTSTALDNTREVIRWANTNALNIDECDVDANGGTAIWLSSQEKANRRVWISCTNSGQRSIILINGGEVYRTSVYSNDELDNAAFFLSE